MSKIKLKQDGNEFVFDGNETDFILDQMENAGIEIASSCRSGTCGLCICEAENGFENINIDEDLVYFDLPENQFLSCISKIKKSSGDITIKPIQ